MNNEDIIMTLDDECSCYVDGICQCIENGVCGCECECQECINEYMGYADEQELYKGCCGGNCHCGAIDNEEDE